MNNSHTPDYMDVVGTDPFNFESLPNETITEIFSFLSLEELAVASLVSRCFNANTNQPSIWKSFAVKLQIEFNQEEDIKNKVIHHFIDFNNHFQKTFNEKQENINQLKEYFSNIEKFKNKISDQENWITLSFNPSKPTSKIYDIWSKCVREGVKVEKLSANEVHKLFYKFFPPELH